VIGYPSLASAAYDQGRFAATHLLSGVCDHHLVDYIPTGIYTSPEISSVGRTERELTEARVPYEVGHAYFKSLARAQITGRTVGILKLLFQRDTLEILGIHCFGDQAARSSTSARRSWPSGVKPTASSTSSIPRSISDHGRGYRVAALNGLNRLA